MASRAPEQTIRDWLDTHGPVRVGLEAFEQTWGIERLSARDRREIPAALARVGVRVEPSLDRISRRDKVLLSLEEAPGAEPEPGRRTRLWSGAAPEPAATPEPPRPERTGPVAAEPVAAEPTPESEAAPVAPATDGARAAVPRPLWILGAGVGLMIVGSLGPWGKAIFVTDYGLDRHGAIVMVAAIVIAALLALHLRRPRRSWPPIAGAALGTFAAATAASDFRDLVDDPFVGPAWGLYAAFAGCALVVALSMALLARPRSRAPDPEPELSPPAGRSH